MKEFNINSINYNLFSMLQIGISPVRAPEDSEIQILSVTNYG